MQGGNHDRAAGSFPRFKFGQGDAASMDRMAARSNNGTLNRRARE
jgi:hypothetical protein